MNQLIGVYGASGCGVEVMPILRQMFSDLSADNFVFIDDFCQKSQVNHYNVVNYKTFLQTNSEQKLVTVAIADSSVRERLTLKLAEDNIALVDVIANTAQRFDHVDMQEGSIICSFVTLNSSSKIGKSFHANAYSYVAHDCVIGDYVTFAPRVSCNGNVHIHDHAYIGTGAILRQGTPDKPLVIGKGAVVGMGAVVTKDVPPGVTVVGNPARPLVKNPPLKVLDSI